MHTDAKAKPVKASPQAPKREVRPVEPALKPEPSGLTREELRKIVLELLG